MLIAKPLCFVSEYIESLNQTIKEYQPTSPLSRIQKNWLAFCITAIFITNSVCWARFERAIIGSARLHVGSHGKKRFVIALKYEGEKEYRYLVATDLSWRTLDIVQAYTLRWLIEVFLQDWKSNEGWGSLTKQPGEEGSSRSLILSLLADHCLFLHPEQSARLENKLPVCTVGSLRSQIKVESLLTAIRKMVSSDDPEAQINLMADTLKKYVFTLAPSKKHMANRDLGRLEPTPSLKYKMAAC